MIFDATPPPHQQLSATIPSPTPLLLTSAFSNFILILKDFPWLYWIWKFCKCCQMFMKFTQVVSLTEKRRLRTKNSVIIHTKKLVLFLKDSFNTKRPPSSCKILRDWPVMMCDPSPGNFLAHFLFNSKIKTIYPEVHPPVSIFALRPKLGLWWRE